jgi:hypothetical protein
MEFNMSVAGDLRRESAWETHAGVESQDRVFELRRQVDVPTRPSIDRTPVPHRLPLSCVANDGDPIATLRCGFPGSSEIGSPIHRTDVLVAVDSSNLNLRGDRSRVYRLVLVGKSSKLVPKLGAGRRHFQRSSGRVRLERHGSSLRAGSVL